MPFLSHDPQDPAAASGPPPAASVLIPTRGRAAKLGCCLDALARQVDPAGRTFTDQFEVLVGLDGPDPESQALATRAGPNVRAIPCDRAGQLVVRERLVGLARGRIIITINDDVEPCSTFISTHIASHAEAEARGTPAIIAGDSPWKVHDGDTLFDRLVRDTSMLFFYDQMHEGTAQDRWRDWGFRHCWTLNASFPTALVRAVGGFRAIPLIYGHEDIELAYRLAERFRTPVLFRPEAIAIHDHRYAPADVLNREYQLGRASWMFAEANPSFAQALFRRDIRAADELRYSEQFLGREQSTAARLQDSFLGLGGIPADAIDGPHAAAMLQLIYQQHLLLKRWMWRAGLLDAANGAPNEVRRPTQQA